MTTDPTHAEPGPNAALWLDVCPECGHKSWDGPVRATTRLSSLPKLLVLVCTLVGVGVLLATPAFDDTFDPGTFTGLGWTTRERAWLLPEQPITLDRIRRIATGEEPATTDFAESIRSAVEWLADNGNYQHLCFSFGEANGFSYHITRRGWPWTLSTVQGFHRHENFYSGVTLAPIHVSSKPSWELKLRHLVVSIDGTTIYLHYGPVAITLAAVLLLSSLAGHLITRLSKCEPTQRVALRRRWRVRLRLAGVCVVIVVLLFGAVLSRHASTLALASAPLHAEQMRRFRIDSEPQPAWSSVTLDMTLNEARRSLASQDTLQSIAQFLAASVPPAIPDSAYLAVGAEYLVIRSIRTTTIGWNLGLFEVLREEWNSAAINGSLSPMNIPARPSRIAFSDGMFLFRLGSAAPTSQASNFRINVGSLALIGLVWWLLWTMARLTGRFIQLRLGKRRQRRGLCGVCGYNLALPGSP